MDELVMTLIILGILILMSVGLSSITDSFRCYSIGKTLNYKTEWHCWTGCVVIEPDESRVLLKQMRDMEK